MGTPLRSAGRLGSLVVLLAVAPCCVAYNPPAGDTPAIAKSAPAKAHGVIIQKAIELLERDKAFVRVASREAGGWEPRAYDLLNGARAADKSGGDIDVALALLPVPGAELDVAEIPANTMAHFFNPDTGCGLQMFDGCFAEPVLDAMHELGVGPSALHTLCGPQLAATDLCQWHYARAVELMRGGKRVDAMTQLGIALHLLADCTVPQHVTDRHGGYPGAKHGTFEDLCDTAIVDPAFPHATEASSVGDLYTDPGAHTPAWFGQVAATMCAPMLDEATGDEDAMRHAARMVIPLAEQFTAALLKRFWLTWRTEQFTVVSLVVDSLSDVGDDMDTLGQADLYARVSLGGRLFPDTWYIPNEQTVDPQMVSPYAWTFMTWVPGEPDAVGASVYVFDSDWPSGDDRVDVTPVQGPGVDLIYWPLTRQATYDGVLQSADHFETGYGPGPDGNCAMWLKMDHAPRRRAERVVEGAPRSVDSRAPGLDLVSEISGTVLTEAGAPAAGCAVFFRPAGGLPSLWQLVPVTASGTYRIPAVEPGRGYQLRPAGHSWDFAGVPVEVTVKPGANPRSFVATPSAPPIRLTPLAVGAAVPVTQVVAVGDSDLLILHPEAARGSAGDRAPGTRSGLIDTLLPEARAARSVLTDWALTAQSLPARELGVRANGLGYSELGEVVAHLASIVAADGSPADLAKCRLVPLTHAVLVGPYALSPPDDTTFRVEGGETGPGVTGAHIRATLWLGSGAGGYRAAATAEAETNYLGNVRFTVRTGSHCEAVRVTLEVLDNPVNPWCLPEGESSLSGLVRPAAQGDDRDAFVPYELLACEARVLSRAPASALRLADLSRCAVGRGSVDEPSALDAIADGERWARLLERVESTRLWSALAGDAATRPDRGEAPRRPGPGGRPPRMGR